MRAEPTHDDRIESAPTAIANISKTRVAAYIRRRIYGYAPRAKISMLYGGTGNLHSRGSHGTVHPYVQGLCKVCASGTPIRLQHKRL